MNKYNFILVFLAFSVFLPGQETTLRLSLKDAVKTGVKNRYDLQAADYNLDIANNDISRAKKEWLPDVSASGNVHINTQLQKMFIPAGFAGLEDPMLVGLGAYNVSVFGVDVSQPIYNKNIRTDMAIARNNLELEREKKREAENNIRERIEQSYLNVLLRDLQYRIAQNNEQRYKAYFELAETKFRQGALIENDYLKARLDLDNAAVETQKVKQNYELSLTNLKYQINVAPETELILTDSLESIDLATDVVPVEAGIANRSEIRQLSIMEEGNRLKALHARQLSLPTLSAFGNFSEQFTYNGLNFFQSEWWSSFSYVGVRLRVPITARTQNRLLESDFTIRTVQTGLNLKQRTADISYQIRNAATELDNARQNMETTRNNYELSQTIYKNQQVQFDLGALQYNHLLDTEKALSAAEQNYIQAVYQFLLAEIGYRKAAGVF